MYEANVKTQVAFLDRDTLRETLMEFLTIHDDTGSVKWVVNNGYDGDFIEMLFIMVASVYKNIEVVHEPSRLSIDLDDKMSNLVAERKIYYPSSILRMGNRIVEIDDREFLMATAGVTDTLGDRHLIDTVNHALKEFMKYLYSKLMLYTMPMEAVFCFGISQGGLILIAHIPIPRISPNIHF